MSINNTSDNHTTPYHIYGIGAALVDTEIEVSEDDLNTLGIEKGVMTLVDEARQVELMTRLSNHLVTAHKASGGSAANTIIAACYFGANTFYSGKVANDALGDFYLQDMRSAGVALSPNTAPQTAQKTQASELSTGKCLVMITPDAERTMNTYLGISETLSTEQLHEPAITQSQYVYIEGYLATSATGREAAIQLRKTAETNGVNTAITLSDPAIAHHFRHDLQTMIGDKVNLLFCNQEEALAYTETSQMEDAIESLQAIADTFVITQGANGALIYDGKAIINIAPVSVNAVDSNGAGDMFAGAFLYAITHGYSHTQAGNLASAAAAQVVSQYGPRLRLNQYTPLLETLQHSS